jgi:hypothetical protein
MDGYTSKKSGKTLRVFTSIKIRKSPRINISFQILHLLKKKVCSMNEIINPIKKIHHMKKLIYLPAILALILVVNACQKEDVLQIEEMKKPAAPVAEQPTLVLSHLVINSEETVDLHFTNLKHTNGDVNGQVIVQYFKTGDETWISIGQMSFTDGAQTISFTPVQIGTYVFRITGNPNVTFDNVLTVVVEGCDAEFEGVVVCEGFLRTMTINFKPEVAGRVVIQGGLTNGAVVDEDGFVYPEGFSPSYNPNSNASVTTFGGDVLSCEEYQFVVAWEYIRTNGQGVRIAESGAVTGDWTAIVYNENDDEIASYIFLELFCEECEED